MTFDIVYMYIIYLFKLYGKQNLLSICEEKQIGNRFGSILIDYFYFHLTTLKQY